MSQFNMADMFGKINEMQTRMTEAQKALEQVVVEADSGGGMVKVSANGKRQILKITVDRDAVDPNDLELIEDLIVAAVNKVLEKADEAAKDKMQEVTKGMLPGGGIPGFDLSKFGL
jgi:DNA-binding YbaB/EbfC family protein